MIKFHCEHCGHKIAAQDDWTDRKVRCPTCGQPTVVHTEENNDENTPADGQVVEPSEYSVSKTILGKQNVSYRCTSCAAELSSHLEEAGQKRTCPTCSRDFIVPGRLEREQMIQEAQQHAAQKESQRLRDIEAAAAAKLTKDQERQQKEQQQKRLQQQQPPAAPQPSFPAQITRGADRFLRWSFLVAKFISVLIVAACFLIVVYCVVMLAFAYPKIAPFTPPPAVSLQNPSWAEYLKSLPAPSSQSPVSSGSDVQQSAAQPSPSAPDPLEVRVEKLASMYRLSDYCVKQIKLKLGLDYESGNVLTSITDDQAKEMFLSGLERLLAYVQNYAKTGANPVATPERAANWYVSEFQLNEETVRKAEGDADAAETQAKQQAELARLEASEERMRLLLTIGGAIAALLAFLFLPLVIQIEQNTRKQQASQNGVPTMTSRIAEYTAQTV